MTSWKRLFGKKTKKAHRKLNSKYDQWLEHLHSSYGPQSMAGNSSTTETKNPRLLKREN